MRFVCIIIANGVHRSSSNEIESALCVIKTIEYFVEPRENTLTRKCARARTHFEFMSNTVSKRTVGALFGVSKGAVNLLLHVPKYPFFSFRTIFM